LELGRGAGSLEEYRRAGQLKTDGRGLKRNGREMDG
jgi:hypothetical protein